VPANGVRVKIERVNLKVQPVECKCLNQTQDRFPEESVDAKFSAALIEQSQHAGPKHERNELACSFDSMFDVCSGEELKHAFCPVDVFLAHELWGPLEHYQDARTKDVEEHGWPNEAMARRLLDIYTTDPESGR